MTDELKLKFVKNTISTLEEMAKENKEHSAYWHLNGMKELANYYEGKATAYSLVIEFLKIDLRD